MDGARGPDRGASDGRPAGPTLFALAWLALILFLTLSPRAGPSVLPRTLPGLCIICGGRGGADAILNLALFFPLGLALFRTGVRLRWVAILGCALSLAIEFAQVGLAGRYGVLGDVVWNTAGVLVGALAAAGSRKLATFGRSRPRTAVALVAVLVAAVWGGAGWLLIPAPQRGVYYGQWTPELATFGLYRGEVLSARVGSQRARSRLLRDSDAARRAIARGDPVVVDFLAGPPPPRLSPIFSIYDRRQKEVLLIGAVGGDLVLRVRRRGAALRLDRPEMRWRAALEQVGPGDTTRIEIRRSGRYSFHVRVDEADRTLRVGPQRGWALLLYPANAPSWLLGMLDGVWVGLGLGLVLFSTACAGRLL